MLQDLTRAHWIAIALAALWFAASASYFAREHANGVRREARMCLRMQAEARANPICAQSGAVPTNLLCVYKDLDCEHLSRDNAALAVKIVKFSLTPILIAWICWYLVTFFTARRRSAS
jgi:hypothetical protein